jgi:hypothetical protein
MGEVNEEYAKTYLDYLDKEMTIMGILSSFCIVSLAASVDKLVFNDQAKFPAFTYWISDKLYCIVTFIGLLLAALLFYRQRSLLALYYGQISFYLATKDLKTVKDNMEYVDGWRSWDFYKAAWGALSIAFTIFGLMLLSGPDNFFYLRQSYLVWVTVLFFSICFGFVLYACYNYSTKYDPVQYLLRVYLFSLKKCLGIKPKRKKGKKKLS